MYKAVVKKDSGYDGIFITGVKSTGIFCRPSCTARKPNKQNVEFYKTAKGALLAGYRPCRKCKPLSYGDETPGWVNKLLKDVEGSPDKRWRDYDLRQRGLEPNTVRRWFQKNHGMTFHAYSRAIRLGRAIGNIKGGGSVTQAAYGHGFESTSGFNDALKKLAGEPPSKAKETTLINVTRINTPLGQMIAGATEEGLCLFEFPERRRLETQLRKLVRYLNGVMVPGKNRHINKAEEEVKSYFAGRLSNFTVPLVLPGTKFQQTVWNELMQVPAGQTISYEELASRIGQPEAARAVASANGFNRVAIIVPCHRVIGKDGKLRGYGGGLWRKKRLIEHEEKTLRS